MKISQTELHAILNSTHLEIRNAKGYVAVNHRNQKIWCQIAIFFLLKSMNIFLLQLQVYHTVRYRIPNHYTG